MTDAIKHYGLLCMHAFMNCIFMNQCRVCVWWH